MRPRVQEKKWFGQNPQKLKSTTTYSLAFLSKISLLSSVSLACIDLTLQDKSKITCEEHLQGTHSGTETLTGNHLTCCLRRRQVRSAEACRESSSVWTTLWPEPAGWCHPPRSNLQTENTRRTSTTTLHSFPSSVYTSVSQQRPAELNCE